MVLDNSQLKLGQSLDGDSKSGSRHTVHAPWTSVCQHAPGSSCRAWEPGSGGGQGLGLLAMTFQERQAQRISCPENNSGPDGKVLGSRRTSQKHSRVLLKQHVPLEAEKSSHCSLVFAQRVDDLGVLFHLVDGM